MLLVLWFNKSKLGYVLVGGKCLYSILFRIVTKRDDPFFYIELLKNQVLLLELVFYYCCRYCYYLFYYYDCCCLNWGFVLLWCFSCFCLFVRGFFVGFFVFVFLSLLVRFGRLITYYLRWLFIDLEVFIGEQFH